MKVELISKSPEWLNVIWTATRTCKSSKSPMELWKDAQEKPYEDKVRLLKAIKTSGHLSVFEHVNMTFGVEGVSRALLAQYTRHRIGLSFSVQSQRYVTEASYKNNEGKDFDRVVPQSILKDPETMTDFNYAMGVAQQVYDNLTKLGVPNEDARFVLPNAACTNMVTSLNLRSLFDVYDKRVKVKGAQWEIRDMVQQMHDRVVEAEPWTEELF